MDYKTIREDGVIEDIIKKSRFICHLKRITSEEEGRDYLATIKKKHYKANHSCSAMIIGERGEIKRSSDDGEPSGTAGVPMLTVLEKQELTNVIAVVTRYFGGIKLGAGGLIRAYSGSIAHATKKIGLVHVKEQAGLKVTLTYPQYQVLNNFLNQKALTERNTRFLEQVTTEFYVDPDLLETTCEQLIDFYQGKITTKKIDSQIIEVPITLGDKKDLSQ
ncbi:YigZ family protein [Streptococcus sciuri]|uniref:YigZ family protein n=1 Tax=Streptococcus sciuri TaxID=2973939 RepID=A0ABT2F864_9STRE|nr:YigZ family protein [Streptococcus sciuri]MCS4488585.1 YigZ family protein [Streptococcus sciuri]